MEEKITRQGGEWREQEGLQCFHQGLGIISDLFEISIIIIIITIIIYEIVQLCIISFPLFLSRTEKSQMKDRWSINKERKVHLQLKESYNQFYTGMSFTTEQYVFSIWISTEVLSFCVNSVVCLHYFVPFNICSLAGFFH